MNPSKPEIIDDAIALSYIYVPAYTTTSKDVRIVPVDNKRYTMRDIGKLEKRIERLEYYTCLLYTSPSPRDRQKSRMPSSA